MSKKKVVDELGSYTFTDPFTGEVFQARASNHYEANDGVPFAPPVTMRRPTVRERIENLLNRGVDPLAHYVGTEGIDMEVPDDPEAPLTASEANYLDTIAESLAEQSPLPDDGMARPAPTPAAGAVSSPAGTSGAPAGGVSPGPSAPSQAAPAAPPVPT